MLSALAIAALFYLILVALAFLFQRSLLYFPSQEMPGAAELAVEGFSAASVNTDQSGELISLWRAPQSATRPVLIHFHGNGGGLMDRLPLYRTLAAEGAGVLAVGYPGYNGNPGKASEDSFYDAAQAHYDWLIAQGHSPDKIVIAGQSLGTGVATWLAARNAAAGLILEAAYTGMDDMAQRQFPILPGKWLTLDKFRSLERIDQIDMPLRWIHGTADELIPFAMGQKLYDRARKPKLAFPIRGGGHNDLWQRGIDRIIREEAERLVNAGSLPEVEP
ncbi:MAG: alpha/beta hydrolase [Pseudomonadota bacterium]